MARTLLFLFVLTSLDFKQCLGLHIEITPPKSLEFIDNTLKISCLVDTNETPVQSIVLLEISKPQEDPIVFLRPPAKFSYGPDFTKRFHGEGLLNASVKGSYLSLTISHPRSEDGGLYQCSMYYLNEGGILTESTVTDNADVEILDIAKTYLKMKSLELKMNNILDKLSSENETKQSGSVDIDKILERITKLEETMNEKSEKGDSSVKTKLDILESKHENQSQLLASLVNKESSLVDRVNQLEGKSQTLSKTIKEIEDKGLTTGATVSRLDNNDRNQMKSITAMKKGEIDIKNRLNQLEIQSQNHSETIGEIMHESWTISAKENIFENQLQNQSKLMTWLLNKDSDIDDKITLLENQTQNQSAKINEMAFTLAFCARTTKYTSMSVGAVVIFDDVILRVGPASYNEKTGIFVTPKHGLYLFSLYFTARNTGGEVALDVNGNWVAAGHAYEQNVQQWDQTGIVTVLELRTGDKVKSVVTTHNGQSPVIDKNRFSMLTVYLLRLL